MIPLHDENTGFLPEGIHDATWQEFKERFGGNLHRLELLEGLFAAVKDLKSCGCKAIYADGSFITPKEKPGDIDCCWEVDGVDFDKLENEHPLFVDEDDLINGRKKQKAKYRCEFFIADIIEGGSNKPFVEFFQESRDKIPKGIIRISIEHL